MLILTIMPSGVYPRHTRACEKDPKTGLWRIPLTQGQFTIVDECDRDVDQWLWTAHRSNSDSTWYAKRTAWNPKRTVLLHRLIAERFLPLADLEVDHIDGDGVNNRRENLRLATTKENQRNRKLTVRNTSGFKGVTWCKRTKKWLAQIRVNYKTVFLGYFITPELAHAAYIKAAEHYFENFSNPG